MPGRGYIQPRRHGRAREHVGRVTWHATRVVIGRPTSVDDACLYATDAVGETVLPHDGVFDGVELRPAPQAAPEQTLVMACCDPAVGLLPTN